jgi:AcrR family transcriptional regulator
MSRNERSNSQRARQDKRRRKPDERARRTRDRLGNAFVALIHEKPIGDVTVQDVLNRAAVGRSTFYLHFRDKNDLLLSQLEVFLETMSTLLSSRKENRVELPPWRRCLSTSRTKRSFIAFSLMQAVSTISTILRKATLLAESRSDSENRSVFRRFHKVNWPLAPVHWPGACYHCSDGGSTVARRNRQARWMNCSTELCGTDFSSRTFCNENAAESLIHIKRPLDILESRTNAAPGFTPLR